MKRSVLQKSKNSLDLTHSFVLPHRRQVEAYLKRHSGLAKLVQPIRRAIREEFVEPTEVLLDVYHDPEIDDRYLSAVVRLCSYDPGTMKRLDAIWSKFERQITRSSGWLTLTTNFRGLCLPRIRT